MAKKETSVPKFKYWLIEQGITQKEIRERTYIGTGTANSLVNKGKASKSIIKLISLEFNISWKEMNDLLKPSKTAK